MRCRELNIDERFKVNEFYQLTTYKRPVSGADRVYIVEENDEILGAVRIENSENVQVLRGMYMHPDKVRQGVGTLLLRAIELPLSESESYCIPLDYLVGFYGKIGFNEVLSRDAPNFLSKRIAGYITEGKKVVIMHRVKGTYA